MFNGVGGQLTYKKFRIPFSRCSNRLVFFLSSLLLKDTFKLYQIVNGVKKAVPLDGKGIAWWTDYNIKYRNPSVTPLKNAFNGKNVHHESLRVSCR